MTHPEYTGSSDEAPGDEHQPSPRALRIARRVGPIMRRVAAEMREYTQVDRGGQDADPTATQPEGEQDSA